MSKATPQGHKPDVLDPTVLGFDPAEVRHKYAEERAKRMRAEGNDQFVEVVGEYAQYEQDPHVAPGFSREAIKEELDVVILGGGIAGLVAAVRLQQAGVSDVRIIDKAGDFGGFGTRTAILVPSATPKPISICRCWKKPATSPKNVTPTSPRFLNI